MYLSKVDLQLGITKKGDNMIQIEKIQYGAMKEKRKEMKKRGFVSSVYVASNLRNYHQYENIIDRQKLFPDMKRAAKNNDDISAVAVDIWGTVKMYYLADQVEKVLELANEYRGKLK